MEIFWRKLDPLQFILKMSIDIGHVSYSVCALEGNNTIGIDRNIIFVTFIETLDDFQGKCTFLCE